MAGPQTECTVVLTGSPCRSSTQAAARIALTAPYALIFPSLAMKPRALILTLVLAARAATAGVPVCDFETDADLTTLRWASQGESTLARAAEFASNGASSLLFRSPAWKKGQPEWPAFEWTPAVRDWTPYDRLVVDLVNLRPEQPLLALFVSDSKVPFRQGLSYRFELTERGFRRCVIPLASFPPAVNRADISILHVFTERPAADLAVHLDNLTLLKPGEALPEVPAAFVRQLAVLQTVQLAAARAAILAARLKAGGPEIKARFDDLEKRTAGIEKDLGSLEIDLAKLGALGDELAALPEQAARWVAIARFQQQCAEAGRPAAGLLVGLATSMEKILPRATGFEMRPATKIDLSLARNEKESVQVLVLPVSETAREVTVRAEDLKSPTGAVFPANQIQCEVMGYVQTQTKPPYGSSHIGWWPDPILDFLGPVEVAAGDVQSFWIRVRAPRTQAAGIYQGKLTVMAAGTANQVIPLTVKVRSFTLPTQSPLPVAITFAPSDHPTDDSAAHQSEWRKSPDYPVNAWQKHKLRWADFLAEYYINFDSLYRHGPPDFEVIQHLRDRGQLTAFNLGIFDVVSRGPEQAKEALAGLHAAYDQAKALGVLDKAYIYGFDECQPEMFPLLEETAQTLRREFPGVLLMTTSYDHSYGQDTVVKSIDAWCPLTPKFDPAQAAKARAAGRQVWWYICCGPHHPHANMFIEYPAIEARLLMGPMTAKQRPDGFLYYQTSIWNSRLPITSGPFTDWDPRSWTTYHGDGSWTCVGPDGVPLPTIRLENFRDGLEDYAYFRILEQIARECEANGAADPQWLAAAKAALAVPDTLVHSMTDYSRDPSRLYAWREQLGELIDKAGHPDADPWAKKAQ